MLKENPNIYWLPAYIPFPKGIEMHKKIIEGMIAKGELDALVIETAMSGAVPSIILYSIRNFTKETIVFLVRNAPQEQEPFFRRGDFLYPQLDSVILKKAYSAIADQVFAVIQEAFSVCNTPEEVKEYVRQKFKGPEAYPFI